MLTLWQDSSRRCTLDRNKILRWYVLLPVSVGMFVLFDYCYLLIDEWRQVRVHDTSKFTMSLYGASREEKVSYVRKKFAGPQGALEPDRLMAYLVTQFVILDSDPEQRKYGDKLDSDFLLCLDFLSYSDALDTSTVEPYLRRYAQSNIRFSYGYNFGLLLFKQEAYCLTDSLGEICTRILQRHGNKP